MNQQPLKGHLFSRELRQGPYSWPGGYPRHLIMMDGERMCFACAQEERARVRLAAMTNDGEWAPMAFDVMWECEPGDEPRCVNCDGPIEVAYPNE